MNIEGLLLNKGFTDRGHYLSGPCPVHQGDNKTACVFYKETKIWKCYTRGCHEDSGALFKALGTARPAPKDIVDEPPCLTPIMTLNSYRQQFACPSPYFINRGFSREVLLKFHIGACFNAKNFLCDRSIVPMFYQKQIIGWSARAHGPQEPKWLHSKGLNKSYYLFNMDALTGDAAILCEGPMDAIRVSEAGFPSVVALLGSQMARGQANLLGDLGIKNLTLFMDSDEPGQAAALKIQNRYGDRFNITNVIPLGDDPGGMDLKKIRENL